MTVSESAGSDRRLVIQRVLHEISSREDLRESLETALAQVRSAVGADWGYIALLSKDTYNTHPIASIGVPIDAIPALDIRNRSLTRWVVQHAASYRWPDGPVDSWHVPFGATIDEEIRTEILAPLLYDKAPIGILSVGSRRDNAFDGDVQGFLGTLAEEIAILIQNKRFFAASLRLSGVVFNDVDEVTIAHDIIETACAVMEASHASLWLRPENKRGVLRVVAETLIRPSDEPSEVPETAEALSWVVIQRAEAEITKTASRTLHLKQPLHLYEPDVRSPNSLFRSKSLALKNQLCSAVGMPLVLRNEVIGVISLFTGRPYRFFDKELVLLQNLALRAAAAIANARLTDAALGRYEEILDIAQIANPGYIALSFTHDAKHTMNQMNSLISMLIDSAPKPFLSSPAGVNIVASLNEHTRYLKTLFNSLINVAKTHDIEPKIVPISQILENVVYLFKPKLRNIRLDLPSKSKMAIELECYVDQMKQVFINLINNSVDAIRLTQRRDGKIEIVVREHDADLLEFTIKDNGIGIAEKHLAEIFKPTYTTKGREGSGFGLAICKRIVSDNHNGEILVKSQEGDFTTFFIILPRSMEK